MEIKLRKIKLLNFQGIKDLELEFTDHTRIIGDNATGKTTVFNAFTWLLFGKNAQDQQQFEIKTLDENGKVIPRINHEVTGTILIDGVPKEFKRVLKEKWVKTRGEEEAKFTGNTEEFYIDRVPFSKGEYTAAISGIIREDQFKLITNPLYFNSSMDWKTRRNMIFKMAGDISYEEVASRNPKLKEILDEVQNKSIEGLRKQLRADIKLTKDRLAEITPRIDEQSRTMPEMPDVEAINTELDTLNQELKVIEGNMEAINNANKQRQEEVKNIYDQISTLTRRKFELEQAGKKKAEEETNKIIQAHSDVGRKLYDKRKEAERLDRIIKDNQSDIIALEDINRKLRQSIQKLNDDAPDFTTIQKECPTCKRPFDPEDIESKMEQIEAAFNEEKVSKYNQFRDKGLKNNAEIENKKTENAKLIDIFNSLTEEITGLEKNNIQSDPTPINADAFIDHDQINKINAEIEALQKKADNPIEIEVTDQNTERKREIMSQIDRLKKELSTVDNINTKKERIAQLEKDGKELSSILAGYEKREFLVEMFSKEYVSGLEDKINSMFDGKVHFRMFKKQINGGEEEDCTLIVDGVPWDALNSAGKIQSGISCINVIGKHFGYKAPIFCDNAEGVTRMPGTESQLIELIVSEEHKVLTIN